MLTQGWLNPCFEQPGPDFLISKPEKNPDIPIFKRKKTKTFSFVKIWNWVVEDWSGLF